MIFLFVYGTLRRGYTHAAARRLHERGSFVEEATVRGKCRMFGPWLGLVPGYERVTGEIFQIRPSVLPWLKAYEGSGYELRNADAITATGRKLRVVSFYRRLE